MSAGKVIAKIRHFYFNYYDHDTSLVSPSTAVIRHALFALRLTISFLIGGFLAYGTGLNNASKLQYMVPAACVLSIQETFGMTLITACMILITIVPLSIVLFVIQKLGLGYQDYLAAELILLITSLLISFTYSKIQVRKIPLLINAIFFATIVNQKAVPSVFIFFITLKFVIGIVISIAVSLLIFPQFATIDFENRVNYCLKHLHKMQTVIIEAFVCQDEMSAKLAMTRASTIEQMIRTTMGLLPRRLQESRIEPSRCFQWISSRKRKHLFTLTLSEQEDMINSLMFHVRSMLMIVQRCQFNEYHAHLVKELQQPLLHLVSCQSTVISSLLPREAIDRNEFDCQLSELEHALESLGHVYVAAHLHEAKDPSKSTADIRSEVHLSDACFLFQIGAIVRLLKSTTAVRQSTSVYQGFKDACKTKPNKKEGAWKDTLKLQWPRFLSAFKSMVIMGVGSIFVMVPSLGRTFENGQWILVALCLTQGDTVGDAFIAMKMRLVGILFGSMWAYIIYIAVGSHINLIFAMLVPWLFIFGYLKSSSKWGSAAIVAALAPVIINLGRIAYKDGLPTGNYALLRIEENLVGMGIAIVLTIVIFPIFASDLLRDNIQTTLQLCRQAGDSMRSFYREVLHDNNLNTSTDDDDDNVETKDPSKIHSIITLQQSRFHRLISTQQILLEQTSVEPKMSRVRNKFSLDLFRKLISQQTDIFQILHNIDMILIRMNEIINSDENQIRNLRTHMTNCLLPSDLQTESAKLSQQFSDCLTLWSSYFSDTRTRFYRLSHDCTCRRTKLTTDNILKHERHLMELYEMNHRLQNQHQQVTARLLDHYPDRATEEESLSSSIPIVDNKKADDIFLDICALYYSVAELAQATMALGTNIHTIFELETTDLYQIY